MANGVTDMTQSLVEGLFDPYFRSRFVDFLKARFKSHGLGDFASPKNGISAQGEGAVRELLRSIARSINLNLGADETVVILFRDSERSDYMSGSSLVTSEDDNRCLVTSLEGFLGDSLPSVMGTYLLEEPITGGTDADSNIAVKAIISPIFISHVIGGLIAARKDGTIAEFESSEHARLGLASLIIGGAAGEVTGENRNEERLRALAHGLSAALDARDPRTRGHSQRVAMYAMAVANEMNSDDNDQTSRDLRNRIRIAALLHDIGKVGIPDSILLKDDTLTEDEYEVIKSHSALGAEIVTACEGLRDLVPGVLHHHEHFDGSGYPFGLNRDKIPLMARIIAIADAFDAITSDRPFRKASAHEQAVEILKKGEVSKNFDPEVLKALLRAHEKGTLKYVRLPSRPKTIDRQLDDDVEKIYGKHLRSLPSIPHVLATINSLVDDQDASLREIAKVLSTDEGLASRVLKLVNSAYYGLPRMVSTIPLATTILGTDAIKHHVVNIALADLMRALGGSQNEYLLLWVHALKTASWAKAIASDLKDADPEEAFTAGLVHDLGKALSLRFRPRDYGRLIVETDKSGRPLMGLEEEVVGFDHTHIGAWAAGRWMLPQPLVDSRRGHHDPSWLQTEDGEIHGLVRVVHIADIAARGTQRIMPSFGTFMLRELTPSVLRELGSTYFTGLQAMREKVDAIEAELAGLLTEAKVGVASGS
jgi:putative nucleotidyltransferase with HDIG domain